MLINADKPVFSVVMPLYNKERYVSDAVNSVLTQTCEGLELIIVDDGSTDGSLAIVKGIDDKRIHLISQKNGGVSVARNRGMEQAGGSYICFLDADDLWEKEYLATVLAMIEAVPGAHWYATAYYEIIGNREEPGCRLVQAEDKISFEKVADFFSLWSVYPFTFTSAITISRQCFDAGLRFPEGENAGEDQEVWFRMAEAGTMVFAAMPLVAYRREVSGCLTSRPIDFVLPCYVRLATRVNQFDFPDRLRKGALRLLAKHRLDVAWVNVLAGNSVNAVKLLCSAEALRIPVYFARCLLFLTIPAIMRRHVYNYLRARCRPR